MPKAPPAVRRRVNLLADAVDMNATVGKRLHGIDMREIGNGSPLKENLRRARELQAELAEVLSTAIQNDARGLDR